MKNKIRIMSRKDAEKLVESGFPKKTAVVSFCDHKSKRTPKDYAPMDYTNVCDRIFTVAVHDIDIEILSDFGLTFDTYLPEAENLALFIKKSIEDDYDIICQCEYGQSRSAACAAAIKEYYDKSGIEIFADYRYYPNQLIFNKVLDALKNCKNSKKYFACINEQIAAEYKKFIEFQIPNATKDYLDENSLYIRKSTLRESGFDEFWTACAFEDIVFDKDTIHKNELSKMLEKANAQGGVVAEIMNELCDWVYEIGLKDNEYIGICTNEDKHGTDK